MEGTRANTLKSYATADIEQVRIQEKLYTLP
jgi:hypothetical protein